MGRSGGAAKETAVAAALQSKARTRAFARVIGPLLMLVPSLAAAAAPETLAFAAWLAGDEAAMRITGFVLLFCGGLVVLRHRHWSSAPAVLINVFAWAVTVRGAMLIVLPHLMLRDENGVLIPFPVLRLGFGILFLMGVWLTFVGWSVEPARSDGPLSRDT